MAGPPASGPGAGDPAPRLLAAAGKRREQLVELLATLTAVDAPSGDPAALAVVADLLEPRLLALGGRVTRHDGPTGPSLEAEFGPAQASRDQILVLCHYDTVWPLGTVAERPFRVDDGLVHGPGVLDMRGGIVAVLEAIELLRTSGGPGRRVRVLLTPDEETGSVGSRALIAARARAAAIVFVPEPALPGGRLKTARKGWIAYRLVATGIAAHAGLEPERGVSAIDELVDRLVELRAVAGEAPGVTLNSGELNAANPANVIADHAEVALDVRFADAGEEARVRAAFAELAAARPGTRLEVRELHSRAPLERTEAIAAAARRARSLAASLGLELGEGSAGGVSDANLAAAEGVPVLDGLGPEGGGAHALDEWVDLDSLVERTALIALLLAEL